MDLTFREKAIQTLEEELRVIRSAKAQREIDCLRCLSELKAENESDDVFIQNIEAQIAKLKGGENV